MFSAGFFSTVTDLFQKFDSLCANCSPNVIRASSKLQSNQARKEEVTCFSHIFIIEFLKAVYNVTENYEQIGEWKQL